MPKPQKTPQSRVFYIEDRAGPANAPVYLGWGRAMTPSWPQGDVTPVREPSPSQYGQFVVVDKIRGAQGLPSLPIEAHYPQDLSELLRIVRKRCPLDLQVHFGACHEPTDFNGGFEKIVVLEGAEPTDYGTSELGAMDFDQEAAITETVPFTGLDYYEIARILMAEIGKTEVVQEVVGVVVCDARTCGECGVPSDGCQKVFAITVSAGASPGLPSEVIYSSDQGQTLGETIITTLGANEDPDGLACVGIYLVVVSNADGALHYAPLADILDGAEIWTRVDTGFQGAGPPNAIFSLNLRQTWIVGDGGYVYFSDDVTAGVEVQDAGLATSDDLNDIHGCDESNLVAVGDNNAVILTRNGGKTWNAVDGPAGAAVALNCVWMRGKDEWLVGDANGQLWYTRDAGDNWVEKAFPGSGGGQVRDIKFATPTVGYMAHDTAAGAGRILRTIGGGHSWYVLPEDPIAFPANDRINSVAACGDDVNLVFGGGVATGATDGFLVKGKAA